MPVIEDNLTDYENAKDAYKHCATKIRELKKTKKFYVGVTNEPEERLEELTEEKKMKKMYTLVKTKTIKQAQGLEKKLVKVFGSLKTNIEFDHEKGVGQQNGGGYNLDKKSGAYVYLLLR